MGRKNDVIYNEKLEGKEHRPHDSWKSKIFDPLWNNRWYGQFMGGVGDFLTSTPVKWAGFAALLGVIAVPLINKHFITPKMEAASYQKIFDAKADSMEQKYLLDRVSEAPIAVQDKIKEEILKLHDNKDLISQNNNGETVISPEKLTIKAKDAVELGNKLNAQLAQFEADNELPKKAPANINKH